jgi:hypothetical protein
MVPAFISDGRVSQMNADRAAAAGPRRSGVLDEHLSFVRDAW